MSCEVKLPSDGFHHQVLEGFQQNILTPVCWHMHGAWRALCSRPVSQTSRSPLCAHWDVLLALLRRHPVRQRVFGCSGRREGGAEGGSRVFVLLGGGLCGHDQQLIEGWIIKDGPGMGEFNVNTHTVAQSVETLLGNRRVAGSNPAADHYYLVCCSPGQPWPLIGVWRSASDQCVCIT